MKFIQFDEIKIVVPNDWKLLQISRMNVNSKQCKLNRHLENDVGIIDHIYDIALPSI